MKKVLFALSSFCAFTATAMPASAAIIEKNFKLTSKYTTGPIETLSYDFNVRFDNSVDISATTEGLTVFSSPFGLPLKFAYQAKNDIFSIGTFPRIGGMSYSNTEKSVGFYATYFSSTRVLMGTTAYTTPSQVYSTNYNTFVASAVSSAVPEPATWMTLVLGFGVVGCAMRRKTVLRHV